MCGTAVSEAPGKEFPRIESRVSRGRVPLKLSERN
jgi:hypothetical protein